MNKSAPFQLEPVNTSHLRRLFILRGLTILIQLAAIVIAISYLGVKLQLFPILLCVIGLTLFNTYVWFRIRKNRPVSNNEIFYHLLIDIATLTIVLYFSGGASNPFITLFLFPIIVSITILPMFYARILTALTITCYSLLMFFYYPLGMAGLEHVRDTFGSAFNVHIIGMWFAFIFSAGFTAFFVIKMGNTIHEQEAQLLKAQKVALRDQKIIELGTLAASTAHELGTPLGTMNLLVSELKHDLSKAPKQVQTDLNVLKQQIDRCKQALSNLSESAGEVHLSHGNAELVNDFLQQVLSAWQVIRPDAKVQCDWHSAHTEAKILNDLTLSQAITNILDNAADASPDEIDWHATWNESQLLMEIRDRGKGLSEDVKHRLGKSPFSQKEKGLGLGLFLSHAIIERFGGEVKLYNRKGGGISVHITLPLLSYS